jgi:hypothetical protein
MDRTRWPAEEQQDLKKLYEDLKFNIIQIARVYRRSPREVASELVNIGVIQTAGQARGYDLRIHFEYFKSMYENETLLEIEKNQFHNYYREFKQSLKNMNDSINHMQCDIAQLKQTVNEIKELLIHKPT